MDRKWLEAQFKLHPEKKKSDLAKALNLEAPAISKILAGGREIKAKEYVLMRQFFGLPLDGNKNTYIIKPLENAKSYDRMQEKEDHVQNDWVIPASLIKEKTKAGPDQIHSFKVEEDAMVPDFKAGEYVLVDTSSTSPSPSGVFLINDGMGKLIRQCEYIPQSEPRSIKVTAKKEGYDPFVLKLERDTIIGRVIAKIEWVG